MELQGGLRKLRVSRGTPVAYRMALGAESLDLNAVLGNTLRVTYSGEIRCVSCNRKTRKSFNQGYCYPCFARLAQCDLCIVKPELCHFERGTCREPEWGRAHCLQPHYVYLANSSGLKVGITRATHIPVRWLDQGAVQALLLFRVETRHHAGVLEVTLKAHVSDRTEWRRLLKGDPAPCDMRTCRDDLLAHCRQELARCQTTLGEGAVSALRDVEPWTCTYPVLEYPTRVIALNLDKAARIEGRLVGIKGQYLIFDCGVLNVRKFAGYQVRVSV